MDFDTKNSGRHSIYSATINSSEASNIKSCLEGFWTKVAACFDGERIDYLRVELWADSGRLICFGVGEAGEQRIGECTIQVTINQFAEDWLEVEESSDEEFDSKTDQLNRRYIAFSELARRRQAPAIPVKYFDTDSDKPLK